jgi:muconate cycloisomerase
MKITKVDLIPLRIPIGHSRFLGVGPLHSIENILIKIYTDAGIVGIGEASPWEVFAESSKSVYAVLDNYLIPSVIKEDPLSIESLMNKMDKVVVGGSFGKAAIEMALFDIIGKYVNEPVYNLLGGLFRNGVKMSYSVSSQDTGMELQEIETHLQKGVKIFKIKTGIKTQEEEIERLRRIKELLGKRAELRIDYNQSIMRENGIKYCRQLEELDPVFIEQPVPFWDIEGLKMITEAIDTPIMADESVFTPQDAMRVARMCAADIISIKLMKSGGIKRGQKIAAIAEAANIPNYSGLMWESSVGLSAALHLGVSTKNISYGGDLYIPYFLMQEDIVKNPHGFEAGFVVPNRAPGLGIDLDDKMVEKFRI